MKPERTLLILQSDCAVNTTYIDGLPHISVGCQKREYFSVSKSTINKDIKRTMKITEHGYLHMKTKHDHVLNG